MRRRVRRCCALAAGNALSALSQQLRPLRPCLLFAVRLLCPHTHTHTDAHTHTPTQTPHTHPGSAASCRSQSAISSALSACSGSWRPAPWAIMRGALLCARCAPRPISLVSIFVWGCSIPSTSRRLACATEACGRLRWWSHDSLPASLAPLPHISPYLRLFVVVSSSSRRRRHCRCRRRLVDFVVVVALLIALNQFHSCNPRYFREYRQGGRGEVRVYDHTMLDGRLLWKFVHLDAATQQDLAYHCGDVDVDVILSNLADMRALCGY